MSNKNGFNKGFSLGFPSFLFNIKLLLKKKQVEEIVEQVTELLNAPVITTTNFFITSLEYDVYPIDFSSSYGLNYVIFQVQANPSNSGKKIILIRTDQSTESQVTIVDYSNLSDTKMYPLQIGETVVLSSNGASWSNQYVNNSEILNENGLIIVDNIP